jgi:hypothetical protein
MLADEASVRGLCSVLLCTDIDKKNVVKHCEPSFRRYKVGDVLFTENARESVLAAVARHDGVVPRIESQKREDDGNDPIHSRQREHKGGNGEKPFSCSTL